LASKALKDWMVLSTKGLDSFLFEKDWMILPEALAYWMILPLQKDWRGLVLAPLVGLEPA